MSLINITCFIWDDNTMIFQKSLKIPLPQWYTEELYEKMRNSSDFYLEIMSHTNAMKTLNGGILVKTFFKNIVDSKSNKKIHLYSAHEKTLHAFLRFHNITEFGNPDYGSAIIVEKYRSIQNKYYVKVSVFSGYLLDFVHVNFMRKNIIFTVAIPDRRIEKDVRAKIRKLFGNLPAQSVFENY